VPFVLRKIRKAKWYKHRGVPWLAQGDLQADALGDLQTSNNELSVYYIESNKSNLERVVTALAANRDFISNLDYALLDLEVLSELGIKTERRAGETPDAQVNTWHIDLVELSAHKLMDLADAIYKHADKRRLQKKKLIQLIVKAVTSKCIDGTRLSPELSKEIDKSLG